jgi:hypothetical protein
MRPERVQQSREGCLRLRHDVPSMRLAPPAWAPGCRAARGTEVLSPVELGRCRARCLIIPAKLLISELVVFVTRIAA